jgi:hypothetical protein
MGNMEKKLSMGRDERLRLKTMRGNGLKNEK